MILELYVKKTVFLAREASWINELTSDIKKYNITIHHSTKMAPIQASPKAVEKEVYSTLRDDKEKQTPKFKLGLLVLTADIKRVFSKVASTNWSFKLYTITEVIHDTIPSNRIDYLPERYNENLLKINKPNS